MDKEEFGKAVEDGLKLAVRVYPGKERQFEAPPRPVTGMDRSPECSYLPDAPMVFVVISDPGVVDNPDIPSYQPHVFGRCDPPALIPLHMGDMGLDVECLLDTAFITVRGRWRVHCVKRTKSCDCRLVVPMIEQGSVLGVEAEVDGKSYFTEVIEPEDNDMENTAEVKDGGFLMPQMFFFTIPQVNGGLEVSVKLKWSQKLVYNAGQFLLTIPFRFPEYVNPFGKIFLKKEKIHLDINTGMDKEVLVHGTSHPLKEKSRQAGKLTYMYEEDVEKWSTRDFEFSYSIHSNDLFGGVLLKSPTMDETDQRNMFCLYVFPGSDNKKKAFKNEVVFLVDISASMLGKPIENVKRALAASVMELRPGDLFNIIAFNDVLHSFSSCLVPACEEVIANVVQWLEKNFVAEGGTDIMCPLNEAIHLLSSSENSIPQIFLVTDGAVQNERNICNTIKGHLEKSKYISPRISTFGIGSYCNSYFLRMLASIGKGLYAAANDIDSIGDYMQKWFDQASSIIVANLSVDIFNELDEFETYPIHIPDLSAQCPLIISGRYSGKFPTEIEAKGILADTSDIVIDLTVENANNFPLEKVLAKQQIDLLTAQAWFHSSKEFEEKVATLSLMHSITSEYTCMILQTNVERQVSIKQPNKKKNKKRMSRRLTGRANLLPVLAKMNRGFGDVIATKDNRRFGERREPQTFAVINKPGGGPACGSICCCCCPCCIKTCDKMNDQLVIVLTQLCAALSCLACSECCSELCLEAD